MSEGNTLDVVALFAEALKALDVLDYISVYMVKKNVFMPTILVDHIQIK